MLQKQSKVKILDNTGALLGKCIGFYKNFQTATVGCIVKISIQKLKLKKSNKQMIKKGDLFKTLVIHTKVFNKRLSNFSLKFCLNSGILLNEDKKPLATKIRALIPKELRDRHFLRVGVLSFGFL